MNTSLQSRLNETLKRTVRTVSEEEIKQYKTDGYFVFRNLVSPEVAQELYREVMDIMAVIGLGHTKLKQTAQYRRDSLLATYIQGDLLRNIASTLMGSPAHLYLPFTAVKSGGGGGRFHLHQDGNYTHYVKGQGVNLWMALVPMREENGGLRVVPGSHCNGAVASENAGDGDSHRKVSKESTDQRLVEMEPGDCIAFTRWTIHGSGPNATDEHRVAYAVQFHSEDAVARFDDGDHLLAEKPRHKDIWGVDEIISANAGSREGH